MKIFLYIIFTGLILVSRFDTITGIYNYDNDKDEVDDIEVDYNHNSAFPQQLTLSDWDSSLYGKPICTNIPINMSLCTNINYNQMRVPNLIGHESVEEVCIIYLFFV
jgi:hypothetical protein